MSKGIELRVCIVGIRRFDCQTTGKLHLLNSADNSVRLLKGLYDIIPSVAVKGS